MLESLSINNVALIDSATIEFGDGLNALTGETGAGKSLIVDSLSLLLGEKADKSLICIGRRIGRTDRHAGQPPGKLHGFTVDHDRVGNR